jgi:hypothetical protein
MTSSIASMVRKRQPQKYGFAVPSARLPTKDELINQAIRAQPRPLYTPDPANFRLDDPLKYMNAPQPPPRPRETDDAPSWESVLGSAVGNVGGAFAKSRLNKSHVPKVADVVSNKPYNLDPSIPDYGPPRFGLGGMLRRVGDAAIVGDGGEELAVKTKQGTQIIPLPATRPPALDPSLVPPASPRPMLNPPLDDAQGYDRRTDASLPAAPPSAFEVGDGRTQLVVPPYAPTMRSRYAMGEPDELTKSAETIAALEKPIQFDDERDPTTHKYLHPDAYHTPGKGRAFLRTALNHLGEAMAHARQQAQAEGRPVAWHDVASGAAEALGAGSVAAFVPRVAAYETRDRQIAQERQHYGQELVNELIRTQPGLTFEEQKSLLGRGLGLEDVMRNRLRDWRQERTQLRAGLGLPDDEETERLAQLAARPAAATGV